MCNSNLVCNEDFTFYKYHNIKEFAKLFLCSKLNDLIKFKDILELFYDDNKEIKPNNEDQEKDLENRRVVINADYKLYKKLSNIYITQYDNLSED